MEFQRQVVSVNGCDSVVLTAGQGDPLVYFHGEHALTGFDFALSWADRYRVIVPIHPGYGESGDVPGISGAHDYVLHYLDLFDLLQIGELALIGHSFGGWLAACFAAEHRRRVRSLVLAAPLGLRVPEHASTDVFKIKPDDLLAMLTETPEAIQARLPDASDVDFKVAQYRESISTARVLWERNYDPKLERWLHRLSMPTLLLWGENDRMTPAAQSKAWAAAIPTAQVRIMPGLGHLLFEESPSAAQAVGDFLAQATHGSPSST